jgi:adenylosuccinate lyase
VRAQAALVLEGMVGEHERDGRAWKVEWAAFPDACLLAGASLVFARKLLAELEVDEEAMRRNLEAQRGLYASEQVLAALAPKLGKHRAQALLQNALSCARERGLSLEDALRASEELGPHVEALSAQGTLAPNPGCAPRMVDEVLRRAREARRRDSSPFSDREPEESS